MKAYFLFSLLFCLQANAQDSIQKPASLQVRIGINYSSYLHDYGRNNNLEASSLFPQAELWLHSKWYISAAPVLISIKGQPLDYAGTVATAGFLHIGKKWISHLYAVKPFYETGTNLAQATLQFQAGGSLGFRNQLANLTIGGDVKRSDAWDFGATAGLDHAFRKSFKKGSALVIDPTVSVFAGTRKYARTTTTSQPGFLMLPGSSSSTTDRATRFDLLSYECSVPLIFIRKHWMVLVTPAWVAPQNLMAASETGGDAETGKPRLYATAGLKYSF